MSIKHAGLGTYPKANKTDKVYYVNRKNSGFSVVKPGPDGKPLMRTNPITGAVITNSRGEPEYIEESVSARTWQPRFTDLGYWSVYVVTKDTPKYIAEELERAAASGESEIMSEKAFIEFSNPPLAEHMKATESMRDETEVLRKEKERLDKEISEGKSEKSRLNDEINRLKQKAGMNR